MPQRNIRRRYSGSAAGSEGGGASGGLEAPLVGCSACIAPKNQKQKINSDTKTTLADFADVDVLAGSRLHEVLGDRWVLQSESVQSAWGPQLQFHVATLGASLDALDAELGGTALSDDFFELLLSDGGRHSREKRRGVK